MAKSVITLRGRKVGPGYPCFIIAELSTNHHQRRQEAIDLVKAAAMTGADAVKLQTFTPDSLTIDSDKKWFRVNLSSGPKDWSGETLYKLYGQAQTPWEWHAELKRLAENMGLIFFSTPQDDESVNFLEELGVPAYKIASYELLHVPLLRTIARTGKPVIASVGFASLPEIEFAAKTLKEAGAKDIALLHCITGYTDKPKAKEMNLATIEDLGKRFGVVVGFSYNDGGINFPVAAAKLGAAIVEIHVILDRKLWGLDAKFSSEPHELKELVRRIREVEKSGDRGLDELEKRAVGKPHYGPVSKAEEAIRDTFRRSLFVVKDVKKEEKLTTVNVRSIRPAAGLSPKFWDEVIGKKAKVDIEADTPLSWDLITK